MGGDVQKRTLRYDTKPQQITRVSCAFLSHSKQTQPRESISSIKQN